MDVNEPLMVAFDNSLPPPGMRVLSLPMPPPLPPRFPIDMVTDHGASYVLAQPPQGGAYLLPPPVCEQNNGIQIVEGNMLNQAIIQELPPQESLVAGNGIRTFRKIEMEGGGGPSGEIDPRFPSRFVRLDGSNVPTAVTPRTNGLRSRDGNINKVAFPES
ncbi:hypothetical protein ABEB36_012537 [Hypothenemus hampei]|uniref:Uncharacterized protein n=1 Tax=Hypothenemus hampei TaxID=57062 RepID=A0ABD1EBL6_HYPHA